MLYYLSMYSPPLFLTPSPCTAQCMLYIYISYIWYLASWLQEKCYFISLCTAHCICLMIIKTYLTLLEKQESGAALGSVTPKLGRLRKT